MKKNPAPIFIFFTILILVTAGYRLKDYVVDKNFIIVVNAPCDFEIEHCFDPGTEWSFDDYPYKKIEIVSRVAPACLEEHECEGFSCNNIENCTVVYCSDDTREDGEVCLFKESVVLDKGADESQGNNL